MYKQEFLNRLCIKLSALPRRDREERIAFYSEMIDDRIEEGMGEKTAVLQFGSVDELARQILVDYYQSKYQNRKARERRRLKTWEIVLLAIGSPIWLSLLIVAFAVVVALVASLWSVIVAAWAAFAAFVGGAIGGLLGGIGFCFRYPIASGLFVLSGGIVCAGLSIFAFVGCKAATKGGVWLTACCLKAIRKCFCRKGRG